MKKCNSEKVLLSFYAQKGPRNRFGGKDNANVGGGRKMSASKMLERQIGKLYRDASTPSQAEVQQIYASRYCKWRLIGILEKHNRKTGMYYNN